MVERFNFDAIADVYEETRPLPQAVLDGLTEQLASAFESGRVLDAGVGTGRHAEALELRGFPVVGVDIAHRMLVRARERNLAALVEGDVTSLPFRDRAFDHAFAFGLFHLLPDWRRSLREIARVTRSFLASLDGGAKGTEVGRRYKDSVRELGYSRPDAVGAQISDIVELESPALRFPAITQKEETREEDVIDLFAKKAFTWQWAVPDEIHAEAMRRIRAADLGRRFRTERTWQLFVWRAEDLRGV